jgi:hypothetical protein
MTKQTINRGTSANDGTGDNLRAGALKVNENFNELYTVLGDGTTLLSGNYITDASTSTLTNKSINGSNNTLTNIPSSALASIPNAKLTNSTVSIAGDTGTHAVDLGDTLTVEGGTGIATTVTADKVSIAIDGVVLTETSTDTLTNKTISGSTNTLTSIANSSLTNNTVSYGGISLALGGTDATPAFDLADATNYPTSSLSGTITNAQLAGSIENGKLTNNKITIVDDASATQDINLGTNLEIVGGTGISTASSPNKIQINVSGVANSSLVNDSVTIGSTEVNLGSTLLTTANLNLTGTSSLSGTGTVDLTGAGSKMRFDFAGYGTLPTAATYVGMYAYDSTGNRPYYSSGAGWVRILDENSSVQDHTDVNMSGVADGHVLAWSSAQGRFNVGAPVGGSVAINDITDVTVTSPKKGDTLVYGGSGWIQTNTPISQFVVTANGSSAYRFDGAGFPAGTSGDNPNLHLKKGQTYYFRNTSGGHPFEIRSSSGGSAYNTGVTDNNASGSTGVVIFHVPFDAPATLYYQCSSHAAMVGTINIT